MKDFAHFVKVRYKIRFPVPDKQFHYWMGRWFFDERMHAWYGKWAGFIDGDMIFYQISFKYQGLFSLD